MTESDPDRNSHRLTRLKNEGWPHEISSGRGSLVMRDLDRRQKGRTRRVGFCALGRGQRWLGLPVFQRRWHPGRHRALTPLGPTAVPLAFPPCGACFGARSYQPRAVTARQYSRRISDNPWPPQKISPGQSTPPGLLRVVASTCRLVRSGRRRGVGDGRPPQLGPFS
jgi:hypothetical protein